MLNHERKSPFHVVSVAMLAVSTLSVLGCGSSATEPTTPRVINVTGNLAFGNVTVGASRDATMTIANTGTVPVTITNLIITSGLEPFYTASWTNGSIAPGESQVITVRFVPGGVRSYDGTMKVFGDYTSGPNSLTVTGAGVGGPS